MKELPVTLLYSESLFRTIKYCSWWPENGFRTIDEARSWLSKFTQWYNLEHKHSGIKYVTPDERHRGIDAQILEARKKFIAKLASVILSAGANSCVTGNSFRQFI
ncbi:TPA: integrase core domain-containing protein [Escherichia coli]|nr:integrase core domain-containing protein [Escherichia coli]EHV4548213.1 transposase [Escherichia coli]EHV4558963.1 transposase [Escherichia coli]EIE8058852.1 transposase [Escherichia coli]EJC0150420.1 transposase [Escherichia coli]EKS6110874.1 transposase [Escherichia coli]